MGPPPPIWLDEQGQPRPIRPCVRCGRGAPVFHMPREALRNLGWRVYAPAEFVNWCGHAQEFIPVPDTDGRCRMIPILGEAA
jgi:hypothetical protein